MPFITLQEFEQHIGKGDVAAVTDEPGSFTAAEKGVAAEITAITGIVEPSNPADAPVWSKQPAAWMVYHALIGRLTQVGQEVYHHWSGMAKQARATLTRQAQTLTGVDESGSSSAIGKIEGMPEW